MPKARSTCAVPDARSAIVKAATGLFAKRGYHGTKMRDIAHDAGVSLGLLHHHFGGKEGLWNVVGEEISADFMVYVETALNTSIPAKDAIPNALRTYMNYWKKNSAAFRFNLWRLIEGPKNERRMRSALITHGAVPLFKRGQEEGFLRDDIAPGLTMSVATALVQYWLHSQIELREAMSANGDPLPTDDEFLELLIRLIRPVGALQ